jgi:F-type H+-transporting ATPase subunit delta
MADFDKNQATSESYAQALLELADARGQTDQVAGDLPEIVRLIENESGFRSYLADPSVAKKEREGMIERTFGSSVAPILLPFLQLLNARNTLADFPAIAKAFKKLLDVRNNNIDVEVIVPQQLSDDELADIRHQINVRLHKNSNVTQKIDESLIGGLILKIGDSLIDGSVKTQLDTIKRRMVGAM